MSLISTLDYYIGTVEAELEEISWDLREETNFENNSVDYLSDLYDDKKHHLQNLRQIKQLLVENDLIFENDN